MSSVPDGPSVRPNRGDQVGPGAPADPASIDRQSCRRGRMRRPEMAAFLAKSLSVSAPEAPCFLRRRGSDFNGKESPNAASKSSRSSSLAGRLREVTAPFPKIETEVWLRVFSARGHKGAPRISCRRRLLQPSPRNPKKCRCANCP